MDKLQPIIKNHFWILAGLVLPLAMYGFFSANAKLKAATQTREDALKSVLSNIPGGTADPNKDYADGLAKINQVYAENVDHSILEIWNKQQSRMTWPPVVNTYVPSKFLDEFDYRGIVSYQEAYERVMRDLQSRVEPVMPLTQPGVPGRPAPMRLNPMQEIADVPWKQKVVLAAAIPQANFGKMRATSMEIWNAQIDVWLLRLLFDAVARLNEDKDSVTEAILRRIDVLNLVGGDGQPVLTGGGSTGGGGGYGGEGSGATEGSYNPGYGGSGSGAKPGGTKAVPIAFNPAQEFGSDVDGSGAASEGGGSDYAAEGSTGGMRQSAARIRYIADSESKPFLERGFYMSVIIMQNKIPDFLVELANSEWPVRVTRFHVGKNPHYTGQRSSPGGYNQGYASESPLGYNPETTDTFAAGSRFENEGAFGGVGGKLPGIPGIGSLTANLPKMADDAMQHPNLVQLDLCGVITMYKQPLSVIEAVEARAAANSASPAESAPVLEPAPVEEFSPESAIPLTPPAVDPADSNSDPTAPPATSTPPDPAATPAPAIENPEAPASQPPPAATPAPPVLDPNNL